MRCRSLAFLAVLLMVPIAALAQTNPFDGLNARGRAYLDASVYAQQKAQWLARVDAMPETDLPAMAFDTGDMTKARSYAEQLLTEVGSDRSQWNYGDAVHKGNLILGRIAVREGRLAEAVTFLRASGDTPLQPHAAARSSRAGTGWRGVAERGDRCRTDLRRLSRPPGARPDGGLSVAVVRGGSIDLGSPAGSASCRAAAGWRSRYRAPRHRCPRSYSLLSPREQSARRA